MQSFLPALPARRAAKRRVFFGNQIFHGVSAPESWPKMWERSKTALKRGSRVRASCFSARKNSRQRGETSFGTVKFLSHMRGPQNGINLSPPLLENRFSEPKSRPSAVRGPKRGRRHQRTHGSPEKRAVLRPSPRYGQKNGAKMSVFTSSERILRHFGVKPTRRGKFRSRRQRSQIVPPNFVPFLNATI